MLLRSGKRRGRRRGSAASLVSIASTATATTVGTTNTTGTVPAVGTLSTTGGDDTAAGGGAGGGGGGAGAAAATKTPTQPSIHQAGRARPGCASPPPGDNDALSAVRLVFVACCHSHRVGELFLQAGVHHVVCVRRSEKVCSH